jgi:hypothetical protein
MLSQRILDFTLPAAIFDRYPLGFSQLAKYDHKKTLARKCQRFLMGDDRLELSTSSV